jgi:hypothetical protein
MIKIENRTTWNTQELKKLFMLISKHEGYYPRKVIVYYSKTSRIGGRGTIGHGWVKIGIPNKASFYNTKTRNSYTAKLEVLDWIYIERIAQVYVHELGHNLKLRHKEMVPSRKINVNYVKGIEIHRMIVKKKPTRTKLKPLLYKGFKVKIYKYPHRITKTIHKTPKNVKSEVSPYYGMFDTVTTKYGYYYIFIIYKNNKTVYKTGRKVFMENTSELKKHIKEIINRRSKRW